MIMTSKCDIIGILQIPLMTFVDLKNNKIIDVTFSTYFVSLQTIHFLVSTYWKLEAWVNQRSVRNFILRSFASTAWKDCYDWSFIVVRVCTTFVRTSRIKFSLFPGRLFWCRSPLIVLSLYHFSRSRVKRYSIKILLGSISYF